jgi:hypothetical protein
MSYHSTRVEILTVSSAIAVSLLVTTCDQQADCASICNRYHICFDGDYDVDSCEARCNANADDAAFIGDADDRTKQRIETREARVDEFRARIDECDACLTERDCADAAFNCSFECNDVIGE